MKRVIFLILIVTLIAFKALPQEQAVAFTLADRDRIIQTQVEMADMRKEMNLRFEDVNKRFEDVNKRFEDVNKRFEDMGKRIDQTNTYIGWIIALFGSLTLAIFGFAYWDRRTMIRPFETKVREIETTIELKNTRMEKILSSLRELAKTDNKLAEVLRTHHLL